MNPVHFLLVGDLAGWLSRDTSGSERLTSAAVAIEAEAAEELRARVAERFRKWSRSTASDAKDMVDLLCGSAAAVAICSFVKAEPGWSEFWEAAKPLQDAIVRQDRRAAGFVKPANAALFVVFNFAFTIAMAHAVAKCRRNTIKDVRGLKVYERTVVCDSDLQGEENTDVFKYLWSESDENQLRVNELGISLRTRSVSVATEQSEPLLLLADFAAGLGQSAHVPNPGRIPFPVGHSDSQRLLAKLVASGKGAVIDQPFSFKYQEMFGNAHAVAAAEKR